MDERKNASSGTYTPGTLKPRFGPNQHRTMGAIYSHVDPYYPASVAHHYSMDYDDEDEVAALELVSKKPARSQSLRLARNPAHDVLDDFFRQKLIKHDFGQLLTPEQLKGKTYCKFHNMWNHNTVDYVKLKDQIQVWINEGVMILDEEKTVSLVNENPFRTIATIDVICTVAMVDVAPVPKHKAKSKYEFYTYNAYLAHVMLDELIQTNLLNIPWGHTCWKNNWQRKKSDRKIVEESDKGDKIEETSGKGKHEAIPEASKVVLCSRCKVECGIPVSYDEFETPVKAVEANDNHPPPDHYQPASPTGPLKQAEVGFKFHGSNLYKRNAKAGTSEVEPIPEGQNDILTKPYIPPASRNIIKDDTWYIKEKGKIVEINHTKIRNMQKRYGIAKRKLTTLDQGLIKPEDLGQTPEQLRKTIDRLVVKPYAPLKRNKGAEPPAPPRESAFKRLSSTPGSPKRRSVLERLGLVPVGESTPSISGTKPVSTEPEAKQLKSDPTARKGVQEMRL
ncbi:hypothetical protein ACLB2K_015470 [Fragaria x ananassa]